MPSEVTLDVSAGSAERTTIGLKRAGILCVWLRFELGGEPVSARDIIVTAGSHYGRVTNGGVEFGSLNPGTYWVQVRRIYGLKAVPARWVQIRVGETAELVIEVRRAD